MTIFPKSTNHLSDLLIYLSDKAAKGEVQIPSLPVLSKKLKISIASLREQLEVARIMGFVEVRPRTGIRLLPFDFTPAIFLSALYAIKINNSYFEQYRDFRNHLESAYFLEAVGLLSRNDIDQLAEIVKNAEDKINSIPPRLPHPEHREFHALIFSKIDNPFMKSVFDVYWEIYEYLGYAIINDVDYLNRVWHYHHLVLEGIQNGNFNHAFELFLQHKELMIKNTKMVPKLNFE
jgi:DNA-binding FadR family transcriptional regulator